MPFPVVLPEDVHHLEKAGLLTPASGGMRKISISTIFSDSTQNSSDPGYSSENAMIEICEMMQSPETLIWLGFNDETAIDLWTSWQNWDEDDPAEFLELITGYIKHHQLDAAENDNWPEILAIIGINDRLITAIMDPDFTDCRVTATAKHWILDSLQARYRVLMKATEASEERVKRRRDPIRKVGMSLTHQEAKHIGDKSSQGEPRIAYKNAFPDHAPGTTTLYIGADKLQFDQAFLSNGEVHLELMSSVSPSDFSGVPQAMLYTAVDREVAHHYAGYARRRLGASNVMCILAIHVPESFIQSLNPYILHFGDLWKQVLHKCRKGYSLTGNLAHISTQKLIIGHICGKANPTIAKKTSWNELTLDDVLEIDRNGENIKAIQYFFRGEALLARMSDPVSGIKFDLCTVAEDRAFK
jgi:hypothetical protein